MLACSFKLIVIYPYFFFVKVVKSLESVSGGLTSSNTSGIHRNGPAYNSMNNSSMLQGWTPQPNGRGTIDIIWSNIFTIFLCSWSALCLNLPAPGDSAFRKFRRKIYLTGLGILGPEFILLLALGQRESACRSVKDFHNSGYPGWSMSHAYFADMGGFVLHTPNWTPFPLDAKQVHYLVTEGYMDYPEIDPDIITDKNKTDPFVRAITIIQTLWFLLNCLSRAAQHLALTTFEFTTLGFIACTLPTFYCWAHKPSDVETAIPLEIDTTIEEILIRAGDRARHPYSLTPLDFVSRKDWVWSLYWSYWLSILRKCGVTFGPKLRPAGRIPNDNFPELSPRAMTMLFVFNALFAGINICAWNFWFPSGAERILWRILTLLIPGCLCVFWAWDKISWQILPALKAWISRRFTTTRASPEAGRLSHWFGTNRVFDKKKGTVARPRNITPDYDPAKEVPLKAILPLSLIAAFYCFARAYILIEDLIALRALPPSAYDTVNWSKFLPHF